MFRFTPESRSDSLDNKCLSATFLTKEGHRMLLWRRQWHPTPVLLPGKSHGWRSLAGCSPWGRKESDVTERLHFHFSLSCIGEGHGTPLQYSCLGNPMDGGAWRAAVHGVAEGRTRLSDFTFTFSFLSITLSLTEFFLP